MAAASTERKRKWDAEARPCEQFQLLRQITSLTKPSVGRSSLWFERMAKEAVQCRDQNIFTQKCCQL